MLIQLIKLKLLILALIILSPSTSLAKGADDLTPRNIIGPATSSTGHIHPRGKRTDNTGGLHLSGPRDGKMKHMTGPDVINPCAFYGMTYGNVDLCKELDALTTSSYAGEIREMRAVANISESCPRLFNRVYSNFSAISVRPGTGGAPIFNLPQMSDDVKTSFDTCNKYCTTAADNDANREFCGVDDCINIMSSSSSSETGKYCYKMLSLWQSRTIDNSLKDRINNSINQKFTGMSVASCLGEWQSQQSDIENISRPLMEIELTSSCCTDRRLTLIASYAGISATEMTDFKYSISCY